MKILQNTLLLLVLLNFYNNAMAQYSMPKDYHNKTIQSKQRYTAAYFWTYLELNMPDSAMNYVDSTYLAINPGIKTKIIEAAKIISPIHKACLPKGNGTVTYTDTTNIVSIYYTILNPKFAMWLSFKQGDENSKIIFIEFKNEQQLAAEIKKWNKANRAGAPKPPKMPPPTIR